MMHRFAVAILLLAGCALAPNRADPVTGKPYYSPIGNDFASQDAYVRANHLTATYLAQDGGELAEPAMAELCQTVVDRIAAALPERHRRGFRYRLYLTASPQVNAYTYGGGRLHCYLGLVARCEDLSELAGILAHEIGHNSHDHVGQQLGRSRRAENILTLGGVLGGAGRTVTGLIGGGITHAALMRYSREEEIEADDRAVDYTIAAGIDPAGLGRFFERMESAPGLALFHSHPNPERRVPRIFSRVRDSAPAATPERTNEAFRKVRDRARQLAPYYTALFDALTGDATAPIHAAADRGMTDLPLHPQVPFWKGGALTIEKQPKEALPLLRRAATLDKSNYLVPFVLCTAELEAGEAGRAEAAATRALALQPALPQALYVRGIARIALGRRDDGRRDFDAALRLLEPRDRRQALAQMREIDPAYEPAADVG